jgi:glycosyltransferase involved in cell wall biosynthesis
MTTLEKSPELSVVMPAYNEAANIGAVVEQVVAHLDGRGIGYEINVVDDGSRDGMELILDRLKTGDPRVRVVRHRVNRGYGAAIRSGLAAARGGHILVSDGDGQFDMRDFDQLWNARERADLVLGYRNPRNDPWSRRLAGWLYSRVLVRLLLGGSYRDVNCGFKLISRGVLEGMELSSTGALISAELLTRARLRGARFAEVGVHHLPRRYGRATGLLPRVVLRMFRELVTLRGRILAARVRATASCLRPEVDAVESASA